MWINKAETWSLAQKIAGDDLLAIVKQYTHTCYVGDRTQSHDWGYGCGTCPACKLRADGWEAFASGELDARSSETGGYRSV
jgi:7-cyano-7-deazaguanine synthase